MRSVVLVLLLATASVAAAAPVELAIGSGRGTPGGIVTIDVRIDPVDQTAIGAGNDIEYGPLTSVRRRPDGGLDCSANSALTPLLPPTFSCVSSPGAPCTRLRALIFRPVGGGTLPAGPLYSCTFEIAADAPPGSTLPLRMLAPRATGVVGRVLPAIGTGGGIEVVIPTATATPSPTPIPTDTPRPTPTLTLTPSRTATLTATGTITRTRTVTRTPTRTPTPRTPLPTATATATPAVMLRGDDAVAAPGSEAVIRIAIEDRTKRVSGVTLDLLLPFAVADSREVAPGCTLDARLRAHALSAAPVGDPPTAPDLRRLRLVVSEQTVPAELLGDGPLLACVLPVRATAPPGDYALTIERVFAADVDGNLLLGVRAVGGMLTVDADAPSLTPTASPTASRTAAPSASRTASPTASAPSATASASTTATPSATPVLPPAATPSDTATPVASPTLAARCAGDCDGDGAVRIDELVAAIGIANGTVPLAQCAAIDANGDGAITIDEIIAAVASALACGP